MIDLEVLYRDDKRENAIIDALEKEINVRPKKKQSYRQCSRKGCRKKASKYGICKLHGEERLAKKQAVKAIFLPKEEVKELKKAPENGSVVRMFCYYFGKVAGKVNRVMTKA